MARFSSVLVGFALSLILASPWSATADGDVYKWCVDSSSSVPTHGCSSPALCDNATAFATIAEAIQAAADAPDVSPGVRPSIQEICVATPGQHLEDVTIDNSTGALGDLVVLFFVEEVAPTWCSSSGSGMSLTGTGLPSSAFSVVNLWWDEGLCGADDAGPLLSVSDAGAVVSNHRAIGGTGPYLDVSNNHVEGATLYKVRVEGRAGQALVTDTSTVVNESEFASNTPPPGSPLIESSAWGEFYLYQSLIFGNVVSGAPMIALDSGGNIRSSVLAGNVVLDDGPLLRTERPPSSESARFSRSARPWSLAMYSSAEGQRLPSQWRPVAFLILDTCSPSAYPKHQTTSPRAVGRCPCGVEP